jgi:curved DNA-binding protein CbpA
VRAAWRRIAAATHPDREDGGDPARFGAAAAAYALLRTSFGRGEALADLSAGDPRRSRRARRPLRLLDQLRLWDPRRPRVPQRRGAHRLHTVAPPVSAHRMHAAAQPARSRRSGDARSRHAGEVGTWQASNAGFRHAGHARFRHAGDAAMKRRAGYAWYGGVDRGLALPTGGAAIGTAAAIAAVGWTPATIGLVAGALTVTAWGLWRRAGRDR